MFELVYFQKHAPKEMLKHWNILVGRQPLQNIDVYKRQDVVTDLAAILLECSVSGSVNLQDLDEYNTPARRIGITVTPEEHDAMNKALADFAHNPLDVYKRQRRLVSG